MAHWNSARFSNSFFVHRILLVREVLVALLEGAGGSSVFLEFHFAETLAVVDGTEKRSPLFKGAIALVLDGLLTEGEGLLPLLELHQGDAVLDQFAEGQSFGAVGHSALGFGEGGTQQRDQTDGRDEQGVE